MAAGSVGTTKISTKRGDGGWTSTHENLRVSKDSNYIEFIGTVDELQSYLGTIEHDQVTRIQEDLYRVMSGEAVEPWFDTRIPRQSEFILPRGAMQYARAICRRAERRGVRIDHKSVPYLNRLSDYLYKLAITELGAGQVSK